MCDFCKGIVPIIDENKSKYANVSINMDNGDLVIWEGDACIGIMKIAYCPVCGAKLHPLTNIMQQEFKWEEYTREKKKKNFDSPHSTITDTIGEIIK